MKAIAHQQLHAFQTLLSVAKGSFMAKWWRKGSQDEDEVVSEASKAILDSASNADFVNGIELHTGKNIRDQITVEEAEDLYKEAKLRGFRWRN